MKVAVYTKYWTIFTSVSLTFLSLALYFGYMWAINSITKGTVAQTAEMLFGSCQFYFIVIFNLGAIFLVDEGYIYIKHRYYAGLVDYFQNLIREKAYNTEAAFKRLFKSPAPQKDSEGKISVHTDHELEKVKNDRFCDSMTPFVMNNNHNNTEEVEPGTNAGGVEKPVFIQSLQHTTPSTDRKEKRDLSELRKGDHERRNKTVVINPIKREFKSSKQMTLRQ